MLGICKAYTTRVGEGPFPTEQKNAIGDLIDDRAGREFGVLGRRRRCGWFDAVLVRQTVRTSGINSLALTKLDILDGFEEIQKFAPAIDSAAAKSIIFPRGNGRRRRSSRFTRRSKDGTTRSPGARSWAEVPAQAVKYVRRIEELVGCPVALLSTSADREDTILVQNPFEA